MPQTDSKDRPLCQWARYLVYFLLVTGILSILSSLIWPPYVSV